MRKCTNQEGMANMEKCRKCLHSLQGICYCSQKKQMECITGEKSYFVALGVENGRLTVCYEE